MNIHRSSHHFTISLEKINKIVLGCKTPEQLKACQNIAYLIKNKDKYYYNYFIDLIKAKSESLNVVA